MRFVNVSLTSLLVLLAISMTVSSASAGNVTSICEIKTDVDGDCVVDTPPSGDAVTVEGIVLAWKQFGARGAGAIYDPINKCCISVFDITDAPDFPAGQKVRIEGWVGQFAGLAEIVDNPADGTDPVVTDLGFSGVIPAVEAEAGLLADFSAFAEFSESCLIEVCGTFQTTDTVFGANTNYDFLGADGETCTVRIDADTDLVGTAIPTIEIAVTGILGQFNGFTDTCIGYQLLPRQVTDLDDTKCKPVATEQKSWGSIKGNFGGDE